MERASHGRTPDRKSLEAGTLITHCVYPEKSLEIAVLADKASSLRDTPRLGKHWKSLISDGHAVFDNVHLLISILPKNAVFIGNRFHQL